MSRFLTYRDAICGHDELQYARSLDDVAAWWRQPSIGTVETMGASWWRLFADYVPDARIVTVRRDPEDVLASIERIVPECDLTAMWRTLRAADAKLDQVEARVPGVLSVRYEDLTHETTCARVFEHCLPYRHDPAWWAAWSWRVVSGNLPAQIRYCTAYLPQLQKLGRAAKHQSLARMARAPPPTDGFVFCDEPFDSWFRDAVPLFQEHMRLTGQDIEDYRRKNIPLLRRLDAAGAMQILTARSNGRMFGYVVSLISPSLDDPAALVAQHLPIFASPDCPGLGMRLQRESIAALRAKGITEVIARAGVRGSGPRIATAFRRLGFEDAGQMFRLEI